MSKISVWRSTFGTIDWRHDTEDQVLEKVDALLKSGADVNVRDAWDDTVLTRSVGKGYAKVVKRLLAEPNIDVNVKDKRDNTALIDAAWNGHTEIVDMLLAFPGIDVNAENLGGTSALSGASGNGHVDIVTKLLAFPKINVKTKGVEKALLAARWSREYSSGEPQVVEKQRKIIAKLQRVETKRRKRKNLSDKLRAIRTVFASEKTRKVMPNIVERFEIRHMLADQIRMITKE